MYHIYLLIEERDIHNVTLTGYRTQVRKTTARMPETTSLAT